MNHKILDLENKEALTHAYIHFQGVDRDQEIALVQCGHQKTPPGYGYGPMIRDHYLIHLVMSGKGRLFVHNRIYTINARTCFLIYPHQIAYYEADSEDPWDYYWIGLCGYNTERILDQAGFSYNHFILPLNLVDPVLSVLQQMVSSITDPEIDLLLNGLLRVVLHHLIRNRETIAGAYTDESVEDPKSANRLPNMDDEYVRIITSIIQTSFMQDIRVENIADRLGLNRSYLTSVFRKHTGQSIRAYLTGFRIEQACILLKDERRSIASVASEVGFNDPLFFSRIFKSQKGVSPREYRRSL